MALIKKSIDGMYKLWLTLCSWSISMEISKYEMAGGTRGGSPSPLQILAELEAKPVLSKDFVLPPDF